MNCAKERRHNQSGNISASAAIAKPAKSSARKSRYIAIESTDKEQGTLNNSSIQGSTAKLSMKELATIQGVEARQSTLHERSNDSQQFKSIEQETSDL